MFRPTYDRYNIGHIGISLGDLGLAYQAFKVAVSIDPTHGEALNNIAVLEMRRQKFEVAKSCLSTSCEVSPHIFEPFYNSGEHIMGREFLLNFWRAHAPYLFVVVSVLITGIPLQPSHQHATLPARMKIL